MVKFPNAKQLARYTASLLVCSVLTQPAYASNLDSELTVLLKQHPRILAEQKNLVAAQSTIKESNAEYYPSVDATASTGYEYTDRTDLVPNGDSFDLTAKTASLNVTQNLFAGFRTDGSIDAARASVSQSKAILNTTTQQVLFEGITAYISVLRQIRLTQLSKRNMQTLKEQLELEDERVERGSGVAVDVLQAKSRLQISKERYTAFLGGLEEAVARYTQVFGKPPEMSAMALPTMPDNLPASLDQALSTAKMRNPNLHISEYAALAASHQKTVAKSGYYPSLDIVASSAYDDDIGGIRGTDKSSSVVLRGSWNLFTGFADEARYERAVATHQSTLAQLTDAERRVLEEVKLAWVNMETSRKRSELLDNAVNIAGEVYDARTRLRDAGKDTALNVLDAENELFRAQIDAAAAKHDYYTALYRLLLATGILAI